MPGAFDHLKDMRIECIEPRTLRYGAPMLEVAGRYFWAGLASERGVSIAEDRGVERQRSTRAVLLDVVTETEGDHGT